MTLCTSHSSCATGYCPKFTNRCSTPLFGDPCKFDMDCSSGACIRGRCNFKNAPQESHCLNNNDCYSFDYCQYGTCKSQKFLDQSCDAAYDSCHDGYICSYGHSGSAKCKKRCINDYDCFSGEECFLNACVTKPKTSTTKSSKGKKTAAPKYDPPLPSPPPKNDPSPSHHKVESHHDNSHSSIYILSRAIGIISFLVFIVIIIIIFVRCKRRREENRTVIVSTPHPFPPSSTPPSQTFFVNTPPMVSAPAMGTVPSSPIGAGPPSYIPPPHYYGSPAPSSPKN